MTEHAYHKRLRLTNFTAFLDASFKFSSGINAFIGENGSGKTHLLKALYAFQRPPTRDVPNLEMTLHQLFQTQTITDIRRVRMKRESRTTVNGDFGGVEWQYAVHSNLLATTSKTGMGHPVFIPVMDMMGHTQQFSQAYNQVYLDFDLTCYDLVTLFTLKRKMNGDVPEPKPGLAKLLEGEIESDDMTGRFYLKTQTGRLAMPMVAEGIRKIATLVQLQNNGWLTPGSTLYWDEPEANINPILMTALVGEILALARSGIQIFLTTHSYVVLKELDLQATPEDGMCYFSLQKSKTGTKVNSANELAALEPNPILRQYASLYNRDLDRALGKGRRHGAL